MDLSILDLGARRAWVVGAMLRPLHPQERPGTNCTEGCVGIGAGLDDSEKSCPTGVRTLDRQASSESLYRPLTVTKGVGEGGGVIIINE